MSGPPPRVLIVDGDEGRALVRAALADGSVSCEVAEAADFVTAQRALLGTTIGCVFVAERLEGGDAHDLLEATARAGVEAPFVVVTEPGDGLHGREALRQGAFDYVPRDEITPARLASALRAARERLAHRALERRAESGHERLDRQLATLVDATARLHAAGAIEAVLTELARGAEQLLGCVVAVVKITSPDGEPLVRLAFRSDDEEGPASRDAILESLALVAPSTASGALLVANELRQVDGVDLGVVLAVTLFDRSGVPIGSLHAVTSAGREVEPTDGSMLVLLARAGAMAIEASRG